MIKGFKWLRIVLVIAGAALILNALFLLPLTNANAGLLLAFSMGAFLIVAGIGMKPDRLRSLKGFKKMILFGMILLVALFGGTMIMIFAFGQADTVTYSEDAMIVLGAGLRGDKVSLTLKHRLDAAYGYFVKNPQTVLLVSGGQGQGESVSEAYAMAKYLIALGVPQNQVLLEETSTSTYENFMFSKAILEKRFPKGYTVAFVSNDFHLLRSHSIATAVGLNATHIGAELEGYLVTVTYLREVVALGKWLVLKR